MGGGGGSMLTITNMRGMCHVPPTLIPRANEIHSCRWGRTGGNKMKGRGENRREKGLEYEDSERRRVVGKEVHRNSGKIFYGKT